MPDTINRRQIEEIVHRLEVEYCNPTLSNPSDPIDEIVFIVLSEKTDEAKYLAAFRSIKTRYGKWEALLRANPRELESLIREAGMGRRRAELLQRLVRAIIRRFGALDLSAIGAMSLEDAEGELVRLPGVGLKAARCVLLYCFGFPALPVDVHTYRLAVRLGILPRRVSYERSHSLLPKSIPEGLRRAFHVNAVAHGRARCFSRSPRCRGCPLLKFCSHPKAVRPVSIHVRPKPLAIDLFAGAGGLSLGMEKAGFHIIQAIDNDPHAARTYRLNHPDVDLIEVDINKLDPLACLRRVGLRPGDLSALVAGPPCQGFSESNRRTRTLRNPKNHLFMEFLRFLAVTQPAWFVLENVAGLCTLSGGIILQRILESCRSLGYKADWRVLNAADHGVPQLRRRLFIIGNRFGLPIGFPEANRGFGRKRFWTVRQAISDLPRLENGALKDYLPCDKNSNPLSDYQRTMRAGTTRENSSRIQGNLVSCNSSKIIQRYKHIGEGENWEAIPEGLLDNYKDSSRCHTGIYYRLQWDRPAKVIGNFRKNMLIHPDKHRGLSVREAARLQSFPDSYVFVGSIGFQQQQVADAVPPLLAEAVAKRIRKTSNVDGVGQRRMRCK